MKFQKILLLVLLLAVFISAYLILFNPTESLQVQHLPAKQLNVSFVRP